MTARLVMAQTLIDNRQTNRRIKHYSSAVNKTNHLAASKRQVSVPSTSRTGGSVVAKFFLCLAGRYLHNAYGITDYVGGALLALWSLGHESSYA